jgi:hypothetical protein
MVFLLLLVIGLPSIVTVFNGWNSRLCQIKKGCAAIAAQPSHRHRPQLALVGAMCRMDGCLSILGRKPF